MGWGEVRGVGWNKPGEEDRDRLTDLPVVSIRVHPDVVEVLLRSVPPAEDYKALFRFTIHNQTAVSSGMPTACYRNGSE